MYSTIAIHYSLYLVRCRECANWIVCQLAVGDFFNTQVMCQVMRHTIEDIPMNPDSKAHGANMGPTWGQQDHVGHVNLAIWEVKSFWIEIGIPRK